MELRDICGVWGECWGSEGVLRVFFNHDYYEYLRQRFFWSKHTVALIFNKELIIMILIVYIERIFEVIKSYYIPCIVNLSSD